MVTKIMSLGLILLGAFYATFACAQTYKCRNASGQAVYADSPCAVSSKIEKVIPFAENRVSNTGATASKPNIPSAHQNNLRYLDMKIDEAISVRDFSWARQLALTQEHWKKINNAEKIGGVQSEISASVHKSQTQKPEVQIQQQVIQQQNVRIQQKIIEQSQPQQMQLQQLQYEMQRKEMQSQQELQQIQLQLAQQQQQKDQQRQQRRQACFSQLQNKPQNQPAATAYAIRQAGTSAASMQAVLAQNYARDAALCNSIE